MKKQATTTTKSAVKNTRRSNAQPQLVGAIAQQAVSEVKTQAAEQPSEPTKAMKIVDIEVNVTDMEAATDKAQLLVAHDDKGNHFKFWLPKSQINIVPDADEPGKMICRLAAWLYYRTGLNAIYPAVRWSSSTL